IGIVSFEHDRLARPFTTGVPPPAAEFIDAAAEMTIDLSQYRRFEVPCLHNPRRDLTAQPFETEQRVGAGCRDLNALDREMRAEEFEMRRGLVKLLRRQ